MRRKINRGYNKADLLSSSDALVVKKCACGRVWNSQLKKWVSGGKETEGVRATTGKTIILFINAVCDHCSDLIRHAVKNCLPCATLSCYKKSKIDKIEDKKFVDYCLMAGNRKSPCKNLFVNNGGKGGNMENYVIFLIKFFNS